MSWFSAGVTAEVPKRYADDRGRMEDFPQPGERESWVILGNDSVQFKVARQAGV